MYKNATYDPEEDPYNSPLSLQWYFKPSTPNIHLCPEFMNDNNWDFVRPSANGSCQAHPKHFDSNTKCIGNPYKDLEVLKHIQQLVESHIE